ncbi:MAG: sigma 54-interacting transcriptional regulator [Pirellulaceae bacterium]|nr:sigma 54-interacting transcriptional regulator [Pirellulaceae bacterium]
MMERHEQQLETLAAVSRLLAAPSGQRQLLAAVLDELDRRLHMQRGTILLLLPNGRELVVAAAQSTELSRVAKERYLLGEGIVGQVVQTGVPALIRRVADEPRFMNRIHRRPEDEAQGVGFVCVPIVIDSEVVGTLSVDVPLDEDAALEQQSRFLGIVASMIGYDVRARRSEALQRQTWETENLRLRNALEERFRPENIVGNSTEMRDVYVKIRQVAPSDTTALIRGESGTGKELVASAIHYSSPRAARPFVRVNCAALSEHLLESELFGHEKGAFTGALGARVGRFEEAEGGTLFLDEIGDFSPAVQVKLLRFLQEREYQRVGSNRTTRADVRVIAATNKDLEQAVKLGTFRQDLYYRIHVFPIVLPPLRERRSDILLLADHFVARYARKLGKEVRRISTPAIDMLFAYHWPGNVRELENCIEYAMLLSSDGAIHGHHLPPTLQMPAASETAPAGSLVAQVHLLEKELITDALKSTSGNLAAAARLLGITPRMMRYKIKKLGMFAQPLTDEPAFPDASRRGRF